MSTPFGRAAATSTEEWASGGDDWERVRVTAWEVPRIAPAFLAAERRALGGQWFAQEYEGAFVASADTVFRPEDVARAISAEVAPLFARPPAADDVVPLFPGGSDGLARPRRRHGNTTWSGWRPAAPAGRPPSAWSSRWWRGFGR